MRVRIRCGNKACYSYNILLKDHCNNERVVTSCSDLIEDKIIELSEDEFDELRYGEKE